MNRKVLYDIELMRPRRILWSLLQKLEFLDIIFLETLILMQTGQAPGSIFSLISV